MSTHFRSIGFGIVGTLALLLSVAGDVHAAPVSNAAAGPAAALDQCNVIWNTPSAGADGAMPLGNGEVGLNLWVEENGDLLFYVSRTDAWSECNRLLKLGRVRVSVSPNPFVKNGLFRQELKLRQGRVEIAAGPVALEVFVAANQPVVYVTGRSTSPVEVKVSLENWRTERHVLKNQEQLSSWSMHGAPANVEVWESPDVIAEAGKDAIVWYHRNAYSIVPLTLKHQGLEAAADTVRDPLVNRTFGGLLTADGFLKDGKASLCSAKPVDSFVITLATNSAQTETADEWLQQTEKIAKESDTAAVAAEKSSAWWNDFWNRSWIFVEGEQAAAVTRGYALQRWVTACGGRGNYPIKFNGSIFTVDPKYTGGPDLNADWRAWGDCYWWQNTRLPYQPMLARGDFDQMAPLFKLYREVTPLCKARAKIYHEVEGVYFPETMTIFGTYSNGDYGWDRKGHQAKDVLSPWWQYTWQQGLELSMLMLDYYDHTQDDVFLTTELLPMTHDVLKYYDTRFQHRDATGKLIISPTQSAETYWHNVVNDTPSVAGLEAVLSRLLSLPKEKVATEERQYWEELKAVAPPVPVKTENGKSFVLPAAAYNPKRSNCENPELYAVSPFRLFGVGKPDIATGIETYHRRIAKATFGWSIDGHCAALLGMTDEAQRQLLAKAANSNPKHRFPAMWGPNYDWVPDQDHGGNLMLTLQYMVMQADGDKIYLLPSWPKLWSVKFKLHAPKNTVVEGEYRNGKIADLKVTPAERRKDVVVGSVASQ